MHVKVNFIVCNFQTNVDLKEKEKSFEEGRERPFAEGNDTEISVYLTNRSHVPCVCSEIGRKVSF